jgi:hypothetical protein
MQTWLAILPLLLTSTYWQQSPYVPSAREKELAGCYLVRLGDWRENPGSPVPQFELPSTIELKLEPAGWRGLKVSPDIPELVRPGLSSVLWPRWRFFEPDSLSLVWSTGFHGVVLTVAPSQGDTVLTGYAKSVQDQVSRLPVSWAPVELVKVRCPQDCYLTRRLTVLASLAGYRQSR